MRLLDLCAYSSLYMYLSLFYMREHYCVVWLKFMVQKIAWIMFESGAASDNLDEERDSQRFTIQSYQFESRVNSEEADGDKWKHFGRGSYGKQASYENTSPRLKNLDWYVAMIAVDRFIFLPPLRTDRLVNDQLRNIVKSKSWKVVETVASHLNRRIYEDLISKQFGEKWSLKTAVLDWRHIRTSYSFQPCFLTLFVWWDLLVAHVCCLCWIIGTPRDAARSSPFRQNMKTTREQKAKEERSSREKAIDYVTPYCWPT